jgi:hypothetical protein
VTQPQVAVELEGARPSDERAVVPLSVEANSPLLTSSSPQFILSHPESGEAEMGRPDGGGGFEATACRSLVVVWFQDKIDYRVTVTMDRNYLEIKLRPETLNKSSRKGSRRPHRTSTNSSSQAKQRGNCEVGSSREAPGTPHQSAWFGTVRSKVQTQYCPPLLTATAEKGTHLDNHLNPLKLVTPFPIPAPHF